jgi:broad specificity phosphatase PhoE
MAMPNTLTFVRHGQSEANVVQGREEHDVEPETEAT